MPLYGPPAGTVVETFAAPMAPKPIDQPLGGSAPTINLNEPHGDYGGIIPISMGTRRLPGQVIWAKPIYGSEASGYFADFAVAWGFNGDTDPSATTITKLWANGTKIWAAGFPIMPGTWTVALYTGTDTQTANATIVAAGGAQTGYRGVLYGVFTNFPITKMWDYGIPGISAEIAGVIDEVQRDYIVIRYRWEVESGGNLETRTAFSGLDASVDGMDVKAQGVSFVGDYLFFAGDTDGFYGLQTVLIDCAAIRRDFPDVDSFNLRVRAYWYQTYPSIPPRGTGDITYEIAQYRGGTMTSTLTGSGAVWATVDGSTHNGWDWINAGGTLISSVAPVTTNVPAGSEDVYNYAGYDVATIPITLPEDSGSADTTTLRAFIERVGQYAGLDPVADMIFDPAINDVILGGVIGEDTDFGEFVQNLGKFTSFDTFEAEAIKFVRSSSNVIDATIPTTALLNQGDRAITTTRAEDDSPIVLEGRYMDQTQQFRFNSQRARRIIKPTPSTESRRHMRLAVPLVLTANAAISYLGRAIYRMADQNVLHTFQLPPRWFGVEPGDVLAITAGDTEYTVKIHKVEIGPDLSVTVDAINLHTTEDIELEGDSGQPLPEYNGPT